MNESLVMQNYLKLVSKLYEIAAQFSREELRAIREYARSENNRAVESAVLLLLDLHGGGGTQDSFKSSETAAPPRQSRSTPLTLKRRERALREMLMSKELFRTTEHLINALPLTIELRAKESRARYVSRVIAAYRSMKPAEQEQFMKDLQLRLGGIGTGSFVSRWSKLIKDL